MGMITRVRGRMQYVPKLNPQYQEEKIAQSMCLLSVVVLTPWVSHSAMPLMLVLCSWLTTYSCVAVPLLASAKCRYSPMFDIHVFYRKLKEIFAKWSEPGLKVLKKIYKPIDRAENVFLTMQNLFILVNQILFFVVCDRVLISNEVPAMAEDGTVATITVKRNHVTSLYSLMFYNVIAYCVTYIKELCEKEDWSPYVHVDRNCNVKHLAMSATKIALEWTKAITFIMSVTFMLLAFGLEQKLDNFRPTPTYTVVTWCYYMCTEKVFVSLFPSLLSLFQLERFESLEQLYAPVILQAITIGATALFVLPLPFYGHLGLALAALYINVFLRMKHAQATSLKDLKTEQRALVPFRYATNEELEEFDDVCAVCLSNMRTARITPCHHLFHANCLRQCLRNTTNCPICKQELVLQ